jgi:hypothetical protein
MKEVLIIFLVFIIVSGCVTAQSKEASEKSKTVLLDFRNSLLYEKGYNEIEVEIPKGLKKKRVNDYHGYREYRFTHRDGSVFYVSTNIYDGSRLNYGNLMSIGIDTYSNSRRLELVDTIKNTGAQANGRYWLEYILGDVVVGYYNASTERKPEFDKALATIRRKE